MLALQNVPEVTWKLPGVTVALAPLPSELAARFDAGLLDRRTT
ncbi:hypothetical protein SALBM135S_09494 [Streptomyces alboniger]